MKCSPLQHKVVIASAGYIHTFTKTLIKNEIYLFCYSDIRMYRVLCKVLCTIIGTMKLLGKKGILG